MTEPDTEDCPYCEGQGTIKRRYGTVGPGPAKRVKTRECPLCGGSGEVRERD
jgi:DnaJ-class molecular chaperone